MSLCGQPPPNRPIRDSEKGHRQDKGEDQEAGDVEQIFPDLPRLPVHALKVGESRSSGGVNVHLRFPCSHSRDHHHHHYSYLINYPLCQSQSLFLDLLFSHSGGLTPRPNANFGVIRKLRTKALRN
ncbi:hypothetical protein TYRP_023026 [Tyrophagus putrescentiae]|nr:hypothetical protein TYRP_023026 [Tyrophagus putrescentiae]